MLNANVLDFRYLRIKKNDANFGVFGPVRFRGTLKKSVGYSKGAVEY